MSILASKHRMMLSFMLAGITLAAAPAALGQPDADDPYETLAFKACLADEHTTISIIRCELAEHGRQDDKLDALVKVRLARLSGAARDDFVAEQAAWRASADAACRVYQHQPGEWSSVKAQGCYIDADIQRRLALAPG